MAAISEKLVIKQMLIPAERYPVKATYLMSPVGITIHETDNNAPAYNEIYFMGFNPSNFNTYKSFHYAVDEKEAIQGLPLNRGGWHAGDGTNGKGNRQTIGIEICRNYRTNDLTNYYKSRNNAEILAGWLLFQYGWNERNLYRHKDFMNKNCPRNINDQGYWEEFKKKAVEWKAVFAGQPKPTPNPVPNDTRPKGYQKPSGTYSEKGRFTNTSGDNIHMRQYVPEVGGVFNGRLGNGEFVDYVDVYKGNGFVWVGNGTTWIPTGRYEGGKRLEDAWGTFTTYGGTATPAPKPTPAPAPSLIQVGSRVSYSGRVYGDSNGNKPGATVNGTFVVQYLNNSAYGVHLKDLGWVKRSDVKLVGGGAAAPAPKPTPAPIKVGDRVLVRKGAKDYNGGGVTSAWYTTPKVVSQLKGSRAVLDITGWCTPFNVKDLYKA